MVVNSCNSKYVVNYLVDYIWRFIRNYTIYLLNFLMTWLKNNKEILIQIILFSVTGFFLHKPYLLIASAILICILPFSKIGSFYIATLNKLTSTVGRILKSILFGILFYLILLPISLLKKKENKSVYILPDKQFTSDHFKKLW